jgi:hypothetical protein
MARRAKTSWRAVEESHHEYLRADGSSATNRTKYSYMQSHSFTITLTFSCQAVLSNFNTSLHQFRPWDPPSFQLNGYRIITEGKEATAWR